MRVGGVDLRELDPEALRSRIGVLFQDYASYELSVRENVQMGRPGGRSTTTSACWRRSKTRAATGW